MASDRKEKMFAVRLGEDILATLDREAASKKTSKSQLVRDIIQNYFHVVKPKQTYEKITMGRNMFKLCLESLNEGDLEKFSEMGISNALREQDVLGNRSTLGGFREAGKSEEFYASLMNLFSNAYTSDGLGWLTSIEYKYLEAKDCLYLKLNHDLNEKFSYYLLGHYPKIFGRISEMEWIVLDSAVTDTKLELYLRIIPAEEP